MIPDRRSADSLGAQALTLLREEVLRGRFAPGARLNELRLANEFSLSRGPVREALRGLEREGLVVSLPNRGSFVARVTPDYLAEIHDLREVIEPEAARRCLARRSHAIAGPLLEALREMRSMVDAGSVDRMPGLHARFHGVVYREAPGRLWAELWDRLEVPLRISMQPEPPTLDALAAEVDRHQALAEVLIAGDADAAAEAIVRHLEEDRAKLPFPFSGALSVRGEAGTPAVAGQTAVVDPATAS